MYFQPRDGQIACSALGALYDIQASPLLLYYTIDVIR